MKALSVIVLAAIVISSGADDSNQKEKRNTEAFENTQHEERQELPRSEYRQELPRSEHRQESPRFEYRQELPRSEPRQESPRSEYRQELPRSEYRQELPQSEYRHQLYNFKQQPLEMAPAEYMILVNEDEFHRFQQYRKNIWESQRVHNSYKHFNHNDNYEVNLVPKPHREQMKQVLYQAVPYPVEVPRPAQEVPRPVQEVPRPVQEVPRHVEESSDAAVEIQRSIPIYTEKQIHYVMKHPNAAQEQVAEKPLFREVKVENQNRQPQRGAVHGERPQPAFMQYPILIVKNGQHQQKPKWH